MSGFWRTVPPVDEKFPGVIGLPSAWKNTRLGPSELKVSTTFEELNGFGNGPIAALFWRGPQESPRS